MGKSYTYQQMIYAFSAGSLFGSGITAFIYNLLV